MDHFAGHNGISTSGQMIGGRKNVAGGSGHNSQKTYKRGTGSMGPSHGQGSSSGLRPGTAQKRPGSPNTQGLAKNGGQGPSPYSFGLVQQHNNLMGGGNVNMNNGMVNGKRANSQKPGSAPSKNRIRSQSPLNGEGSAPANAAYSGQSQGNK